MVYAGSSPGGNRLFVLAAGAHVQVQRRVLRSLHRQHGSGASVHRDVSHSPGQSSGPGHFRAGEVSGKSPCKHLSSLCLCQITKIEKVRKARLRWLGHVQRRDSGLTGPRMLKIELAGGEGHGCNEGGHPESCEREDARDKERWKHVIQHVTYILTYGINIKLI